MRCKCKSWTRKPSERYPADDCHDNDLRAWGCANKDMLPPRWRKGWWSMTPLMRRIALVGPKTLIPEGYDRIGEG
jgi:hypothetical protein